MGRAEDLFKRLEKDGVEAIDRFFTQRQHEHLFLDFKKSADDGNGDVLHTSDRENLAKAISGFGNSGGGVLVWGVSTKSAEKSADLASASHPINDAVAFASRLEDAVSGLTIPPHAGVTNHPILFDGEKTGYVATLVPESAQAPHQTTTKHGQFFIRAGSSFHQAPYQVLAGMFGRKPIPSLALKILAADVKVSARGDGTNSLEFEMSLMIQNRGNVIAEHLHITAIFSSIPTENSKTAFEQRDTDHFEGAIGSFGVHCGIISKPQFRLPPYGMVIPLNLRFDLAPPFDQGITLEVKCGCDGSPTAEFEYRLSAVQLEDFHNRAVENRHAPEVLEEISNDIRESTPASMRGG